MDLLFTLVNNGDMDLNEVAIFIEVIKKGSFTAAANSLDMPKSTVSTKVSALEKRLGVTLITRSTRKIRLTPAGEAFFLRASRAIDEIHASETAVRSESEEPQGRFCITAPVDIGNSVLPALVMNFMKKFPKVQFEIHLTDRRVDFLEDGVDLAIRAGELKDSSLIARKVGEVAFNIFASPKYLKRMGEPMALKDLDTHNCILFTPHSTEGWPLRSASRSTTVTLKEKIVVDNMNLARSLAVEGAGIALLPSFLCDQDLRSGKLVRVLSGWSTRTAPIFFVYPNQKYVPPVIRTFISLSSESLKEKFRV